MKTISSDHQFSRGSRLRDVKIYSRRDLHLFSQTLLDSLLSCYTNHYTRKASTQFRALKYGSKCQSAPLMRATHRGKAVNCLLLLLGPVQSRTKSARLKIIAINLNLAFSIWGQAASVDMEIIS